MKFNKAEVRAILALWRSPGCVAKQSNRSIPGEVHWLTAQRLVNRGIFQSARSRPGYALTTVGTFNGSDVARQLAKH